MECSTKSIRGTATDDAPNSHPHVTGKALRAAIDIAYQQAKESKAVYANDPNGVDASDVIRRYVYPGQSVESACAILQEAGFDFWVAPNSVAGATGPTPRTVIGYLVPLEMGLLRRYHVFIRVVIKAEDTLNEVQAALQFPVL